MKIAIGSDHAGLKYKNKILEYLLSSGYEVINCGTDTPDIVDYPVFANKVAKTVQLKEADFGILICGTGIGMSITANKNASIRAAECTSVEMAQLARQHNDANIICLGERILDYDVAQNCVDTFLKTDFLGVHHKIRVDMINKLL